MSDLYWRCKTCKRYIPDGMSHACTPKPKRRELKAKIDQLQATLKVDLASCNKEWGEILQTAHAEITRLKAENERLLCKEPKDEDKESMFSLRVGGDYACGFCGSTHVRVGGIKAHIRDNH